MNPSVLAMSLPQLFSHDYYCRIAQRKLGAVGLTHSFTEPDPGVYRAARRLSLTARRAGITEWEGSMDGRPLSLGWDWMEMADGGIRPVMTVAPRTNIMLIDARGYDVAQPECAIFLWDFLSGLPWQAAVAASLACEATPAFS